MIANRYLYPTVFIYTKEHWDDAWSPRPTWKALSAAASVMPEMPVAIVQHIYGKKLLEGEAAFTVEAPVDLIDHYIKLEWGDGPAWRRWFGVITSDDSELLAGDGNDPTGIQTMTCLGLEHVLEKAAIVRDAWFKEGGALAQMGRVPAFNLRYSHGGTVLGNRTTNKTAVGSHAFSRDGAVWTFADILEYLVLNHMPDNLTLQLGGLWQDLAGLRDVLDVDGLSLREAIDKVVDRRIGYGWCLRTTGAGALTVHVFSHFQANVVVGADTFHANAEQAALVTTDMDDLAGLQVRYDAAPFYDEVIALGNRVVACFTVSLADGSLEPAWTAADETSYKDGAKAVAGYAALAVPEKEYINDLARADELVHRAYRRFRIPLGWTYWLNGGLYPAFMPVTVAGALDGNSMANVFEFARPLLSRLPLEAGRDYTAANWPSAFPADAEPQYSLPFVILQDGAGRYHMAHDLRDLQIPNGRLEMCERETAFDLTFQPQHLLGFNRWAGAEPSAVDPQFDLSLMQATIAMQTDERMYVRERLGVTPSAEYWRTIVLQLTDAELWYAVQGTIVGVDPDGLTLTPFDATKAPAANQIAGAGGVIVAATLRDDTAALVRMAKLASSWYGTWRGAVNLAAGRIAHYGAVGSMVTDLTNGADVLSCNSVVTKQSWDFDTAGGRTSLQTHWYEMDWRMVAPINVRKHGTSKVLLNHVDRLERAIAEMRGLGGAP